MFSDLDSARLNRSFEYFVENYAASELVTSAHRPLDLAITEFVECTQDFCGERVMAIDRDLHKRNAYTLSFLRNYFIRRAKGSNENESEG